jgi:hypothetical protein
MPQDELSMTTDAPGHVASTEWLGGWLKTEKD